MDNEQQKDEIIALESIYTTDEFSYNQINNEYVCELKIFVDLGDDFFLTYKDTRQDDELPEEKVLISRLPPLTLSVKLPNDYPLKSPPKFTLHCSWLRQPILGKLCKKLDVLWSENQGQEILFTWMSFLQSETLEFLNIKNNLNISHAYTSYKIYIDKKNHDNTQSINKNEASGCQDDKLLKNNKLKQKKQSHREKNKNIIDNRAIIDRPKDQNPVQYFLDYNDKRLKIEFKKNYYICKICFLDKSGESCTQFKPCLHIFCKDCICEYVKVKIADGAVKDIGCPEEKCTSEASPGQIKDLVSPELFAKYDSTLLAATLDTMLDIIYCPRKDCQYPVSKEADEKMASCPSCQYTFCVFCKMVYHGVEPCRVVGDKQTLVKDYLNGTKEKKLELENRYGKKQLHKFIENVMSEDWITSNSHNCPQCNTAIEKSDGCNKMTCGRCQAYFCWTCGDRLNKEKPYLHYENPQSKCYMKLYQGLMGDDDEDDEDFEYPAVYLHYDSEDDDDYSDDDFVIDLDL